MASPHKEQSTTAPPLAFKKKTRRAPKKQKKNKKPYYKLSWKEKEEENEKDRMKGEARVASNKAAAPNNTTQFLMQEHHSSTPNQTPVNGINFESSDEGEVDYNSMSSDDHYEEAAMESSGVFMENDFKETFNNIKAETLESRSKTELISEIVNLEKANTDLVQEVDWLKQELDDDKRELEQLRVEICQLRNENHQLHTFNEGKIPITPVKNNLGVLNLDDSSNSCNK